MDIYSVHGTKLKRVKEDPFKKEKELQALCETNLKALFGLAFVKSEFQIGSFRVDTVGFDPASRSFVIIEYKRDSSFSVVDQGYAYLSVMLNNKADFILEYNECQGDSLRRSDVDWSQSKAIFVSGGFTNYQKESINFRDLPIELWEAHRFANESLVVNRITPARGADSIKTVSGKSKTIKQVSKEVKVYSEEDHFAGSSDDIRDLYEAFKGKVLGIAGDIDLNPKKYYLAFQVGNKNVTDAHLYKKHLTIWINLPKGELEDSFDLTRDVSTVGHWGNGDYEVKLTDDADLDSVVKLIRQSYEKNSADS